MQNIKCKIKNYLCGLVLLTLVVGCGKKAKRITETAKPPEKPVMETVQPLIKKTTFYYEYRAANMRSPFAPLSGAGKVISTEPESEVTVTVDINNLVLKGIIYDEKSRNALLSAPSGESYIVKEGKLLAQNGKYVEGIAGIVKKESVVLITKGNIIKEVKLRKEEY